MDFRRQRRNHTEFTPGLHRPFLSDPWQNSPCHIKCVTDLSKDLGADRKVLNAATSPTRGEAFVGTSSKPCMRDSKNSNLRSCSFRSSSIIIKSRSGQPKRSSFQTMSTGGHAAKSKNRNPKLHPYYGTGIAAGRCKTRSQRRTGKIRESRLG